MGEGCRSHLLVLLAACYLLCSHPLLSHPLPRAPLPPPPSRTPTKTVLLLIQGVLGCGKQDGRTITYNRRISHRLAYLLQPETTLVDWSHRWPIDWCSYPSPDAGPAHAHGDQAPGWPKTALPNCLAWPCCQHCGCVESSLVQSGWLCNQFRCEGRYGCPGTAKSFLSRLEKVKEVAVRVSLDSAIFFAQSLNPGLETQRSNF